MHRALIALLATALVFVGATPADTAPGTTVTRAADPSTSTVVVAGDSVVAGTYLPPGQTFAALLGARLGYPVRSVARPGQRCWAGPDSLEAQWPSIVDAVPRPTTIVVHIETNDVGAPGVSNQQLVDCWRFLYFDPQYGAVARGIRVIPMLIVPTAPTRTDMSSQRTFVNAWLPGFFGASAVADTVTPLAGANGTWVQPSYCWDYYSGSGVHPSWLGVQGMVAYFPVGLIQ
ncbi:SGNH/GDSL hydrolase family protein [Dactylosporangium salmoneum]|uniref:SGNH hydrolase-type esterase domain-containing protein n=1 Tax=Dactylosporangium salmoneum TaxID=53361 RepID=A0ABN3G9G1_9ACTN